ncbi:MAG: cupin [Chlamydiae bacterium]|nr:cupin [Chlamydiota bacterium]
MKCFVFFLPLVLFGTELTIFDDRTCTELERTSCPCEIEEFLDAVNIRFEQWEASQPLSDSATEEEIRSAYQSDIDKLKAENGFQHVDVLRMSPNHPRKLELRKKYLNEHTHNEDEVRFFVEGSGLFFLHVQGKVYRVLCERGDLISIPPLYPHWFDMGENPSFTAIRFFTREDGWIAHFTGDPISMNFVNQFPEK